MPWLPVLLLLLLLPALVRAVVMLVVLGPQEHARVQARHPALLGQGHGREPRPGAVHQGRTSVWLRWACTPQHRHQVLPQNHLWQASCER